MGTNNTRKSCAPAEKRRDRFSEKKPVVEKEKDSNRSIFLFHTVE